MQGECWFGSPGNVGVFFLKRHLKTCLLIGERGEGGERDTDVREVHKELPSVCAPPGDRTTGFWCTGWYSGQATLWGRNVGLSPVSLVLGEWP